MQPHKAVVPGDLYPSIDALPFNVAATFRFRFAYVLRTSLTGISSANAATPAAILLLSMIYSELSDQEWLASEKDWPTCLGKTSTTKPQVVL
jgi:hypothetical protein